MSNSQACPSRRSFLAQATVTAFGAATLLPSIFRSKALAQAPAAKPVAVSETDPTAKALGYVADGSKVDLKKWPKKAGPDGAKQACANCVLFKAEKGTNEAMAACPLFPGKVVAAKGWCNSWAKSPTAKM